MVWYAVSDNPVAQKLLVKQLERFDLHVVATSNGEEAISGDQCSVCVDLSLTCFFPFRMGGTRSGVF